ncbi:MAG: hypothetical protein FH756_13700 [Firmicutes bacterium]|nr:hypothetical protein [Bacillota bacterium]
MKDNYTLIFTAIRTGLRRGELLGLQWKDINLDEGKLAVRRSLSYTKEKAGEQ